MRQSKFPPSLAFLSVPLDMCVPNMRCQASQSPTFPMSHKSIQSSEDLNPHIIKKINKQFDQLPPPPKKKTFATVDLTDMNKRLNMKI